MKQKTIGYWMLAAGFIMLLIAFSPLLIKETFIAALASGGIPSVFNSGDNVKLCSYEFIGISCPDAMMHMTVSGGDAPSKIVMFGELTKAATSGTYLQICNYAVAGNSFIFPNEGIYSMSAGIYCKSTQRMISSTSQATISIQGGCKDECSVSTCLGNVYTQCKTMPDGCKDKLTGVVTLGYCGVECKSDSDCGTNRECLSYRCTTECFSHASKQCVGSDVYWFDSCGNKEDRESSCEYCENAACAEIQPSCEPNSLTQCEGNEIYWYNSCGEKEEKYDVCDSTQECMNGECKPLEAEGCVEKPLKPCDGAVWRGIPDCTWEGTNCIIQSVSTGQEGSLETAKELYPPVKTSDAKEKGKPNYVLLVIAVIFILLGILAIWRGKGGKKR